jgi:hypothetical protein
VPGQGDADENELYTFDDFLSLSPFIIDENSLKGEDLSKLYFYSHSDNDAYVYSWADDPQVKLIVKANNTYLPGSIPVEGKTTKEVTVINQRMAIVKKELDAFKEIIEQFK